MNRQQQRKQLEEALEVMNLDNYLAFASIFAQDIHYPDLKKLIMDYFESLKNYKDVNTKQFLIKFNNNYPLVELK